MDLSELKVEFTMNADAIAEAFAPFAKLHGYEEIVCSASSAERVFVNYDMGRAVTVNADGSITLSPKTTLGVV